MEKNCIIIHGSFGHPFENWFPWLHKELTSQNINAIVPQFPTGLDLQSYENWKTLLDYYADLGYVNENTILVGHSIAPIFITRYLIEKKIKVAKLVFVSGFNGYLGINEEYDHVNAKFYISNIENIHNYCDNIISFYSDNDPYLPMNVLEDFANKVSNKSMVIKKGGHLGAKAGYTEFPEILKFVLED